MSKLSKVSLFALALAVGAAFAVVHFKQNRTRPSAAVTRVATVAHTGPAGAQPRADHDPAYVGSDSCAECHQQAFDAWSGSHHDLAMQLPNEQTVLGDFGTTFEHYGVTTRFYRDGEKFMVNTEGPDGKLHDYEVAYVFGVYPLQQVLIPFEGGRLQALGVAWDSRDKAAGGQRWFHLYQGERIAHDDPLHWTGPNQNWNYMCADCHSTNLKKNYDHATRSYSTTWSIMNVSCEACHGPGAEHVQWAREEEQRRQSAPEAASAGGEADEANDYADDYSDAASHVDELAVGLKFRLKEPTPGQWLLNPETKKYYRSPELTSDVQLDTCARCHAHRHVNNPRYEHGRPILDTHHPSVLSNPLYFADGQFFEEVYEYGSFTRSRMYHKGVRCSDCHEPHSLKLRATGNALCYTCHLSDVYDTREHHHHDPQQEGASCVGCHMPSRYYMVVDKRLDHGIFIPRPDLASETGAPDSCSQCHADKEKQWVLDAFEKWHGDKVDKTGTYGQVMASARRGDPRSAQGLMRIAADTDTPMMYRATALHELARFPTQRSLAAAAEQLSSDKPMVRLQALRSFEAVEPNLRAAVVAPLLSDPVRAVRMGAASLLASVPDALLGAADAARRAAAGEYLEAQRFNFDRVEAHLNTAMMQEELGQLKEAEATYRSAVEAFPSSVPALVNFADFLRRRNRESECEQLLRQATRIEPPTAAAVHALGLSLARQRRMGEAIATLKQAWEIDPRDARAAYVYAVALASSGDVPRAMDVLRTTLRHHPADHDVLEALALYSLQAGDRPAAARYAQQLLEFYPDDPRAQQLIAETSAP